MATYYAGGATAYAARQAKGGVHERRVTSLFTVGTDNTATLATADVIHMLKVPKGAMLLDLRLSCSQLDTNGSPTLVMDVGTLTDVDQFIDGTILGQAGGSPGTTTNANATLGRNIGTAAYFTNPVFKYVFPNEAPIIITLLTLATAATTGYIGLDVTYTFDTV